MDTKRTPSPEQIDGPSGLLPCPLPEQHLQRVVLVCLRRMATHGIRDAHAAMLMVNTFGMQFRRPLVLLRTFVVELAQCSRQSITLAPCCALRMTRDEASLIAAIACAAEAPDEAARLLRRIGGTSDIAHPLGSAAALGVALADLGQPFTN